MVEYVDWREIDSRGTSRATAARPGRRSHVFLLISVYSGALPFVVRRRHPRCCVLACYGGASGASRVADVCLFGLKSWVRYSFLFCFGEVCEWPILSWGLICVFECLVCFTYVRLYNIYVCTWTFQKVDLSAGPGNPRWCPRLTERVQEKEVLQP